MPGIVVAPDLGKVLVQKQGIFQMHAEDARLECNCPRRRANGCGGITPSNLPFEFHDFELLCMEMGKKFLDSMRRRGYEWVKGSLVVHGPFPSYDFNHTLGDASSNELVVRREKHDGFEHPERSLAFVHERNEVWVDYVVVGEFLFRDQMSDVEAPQW